jgi:dihydroneopterin aldolase
MGIIKINSIAIRANHGCWPEEEVIGGDYIVDVALDVDFKAAADGDDLSKTIDYVRVSEIVHEQMAIRAKLIETVCYRIHTALIAEFSQTKSAWVRITKIAAPIPGQVQSVSVEVG